jgi:hypothetical protein
LRNKAHQGTAEFRIAKTGAVMLAVTDRWGGGGGGGEWQKEIVNRGQLEAAGWRACGELDSYIKIDGSSVRWIVFTRHCERGESFSYRTEKYVAPVLIIK